MNRILSINFLLFTVIYSSVNIESMSIVSLSEEDKSGSKTVYNIGRPSLDLNSEWLSFEKDFGSTIYKPGIYFTQYSETKSDNIKFQKSINIADKRYAGVAKGNS